MRLRLVIYSQRGNVLFPAWEYFIPKVGINVWALCLISSSYWKIRMPYWTINGAYSTKLLISPIRPPEVLYSKGFRWFHPSHDPSRQLSHIPPVLYNFEKRDVFLLWQASKFERTGGMMGEIWERSETSLPCSNPFLQRLSQRFRERWEFFGLQSDRNEVKILDHEVKVVPYPQLYEEDMQMPMAAENRDWSYLSCRYILDKSD